MKIVSDHDEAAFLVSFFENWFEAIPQHWRELLCRTTIILTCKPLSEVPCLREYHQMEAAAVAQELQGGQKLEEVPDVVFNRAKYCDPDGRCSIYQFIDLSSATLEDLSEIGIELLIFLSYVAFERMTTRAQSIVEINLPPTKDLAVPIDIATQDRFAACFLFICATNTKDSCANAEQRRLAKNVDDVVKGIIDEELAFAT